MLIFKADKYILFFQNKYVNIHISLEKKKKKKKKIYIYIYIYTHTHFFTWESKDKHTHIHKRDMLWQCVPWYYRLAKLVRFLR